MEAASRTTGGRPEEDALKGLIAAVESDPKNDRALNTLGNWYYDHRQYEEAILQYEKAKQLQPDEWIYESNIGDAYRALREWDKAIEHYQRATSAARSGNDWAYNGLGLAYYYKKDYLQAIKSYQQALQLKPDATYYVNLADACRQAGHFDDAVDYCENAKQIDDR